MYTDLDHNAEIVEYHRLRVEAAKRIAERGLSIEQLVRSRAYTFDENRIALFFPDHGPLRREGYAKHLEFFRAGAYRRARIFMAGKRTGKSIAGSYEVACHLTGEYPAWWEGKRFHKPIKAWACGLTNTKVRDSVQSELLGQIVRDPTQGRGTVLGIGTGMVPKAAILATRPKQGTPDAIDTAHIRHASGGVSTLHFKAYEQGTTSFSAESIHVVHLDEEPDREIYLECCVRTMTTDGTVLITATPYLGLTELMTEAMEAFENQVPMSQPSPALYVVMAAWADAPHLDESAKQDLRAKLPPYLREAAEYGIPTSGAGAVYPVVQEEITCAPFEIPDYWPRSFALDVGNNTGVVWGTQDRETGTHYLYREYFRAGEDEAVPPSIHAGVIRGRRDENKWIPGVVDPASRGRSQTDGKRLIEMYSDLGLDIQAADNAVESGIQEVLDAMTMGNLKIFTTLQGLLREIRLYRRDKNGKIIKKNDHLVDAMRYWWLSGRDRMKVRPAKLRGPSGVQPSGGSWMTG